MTEGTGAPPQAAANAPALSPSRRSLAVAAVLFAVITAAALTWAKWWPYVHKTVKVLRTHALSGSSSVTGGARTAPPPSWHSAWTFADSYFHSIWIALVAALIIASAVEALVPRDWLVRQLARGPRWLGGSAAGGLLSVPSMMCTCCTAPLTVTLRRRGVSGGSALAYWVGNPTLNPAVLVFMAVVLPWQWAAVRIAGGLLLVFVVTAVVARLGGDRLARPPLPVPDPTASPEPMSPAAAGRRFAVTLGRLSVTLIPEYAVIVLALGAVRGWLFPLGGQLAAWGVLAVVVFAIAGTLFVIPTAGEIPIIQGLLAAGLGAGSVGALLITLPAVSLPSLAMVGRSFSYRTLAALAGAVAVLGIASGAVLALIGH